MSIRNIYDTAANLAASNPVLGAGEIGTESDTGLMKVGDGSTAWLSLPYLSAISVSRVFRPAEANWVVQSASVPTFANAIGTTKPGYWLCDASQDEQVMIPGQMEFEGWQTMDIYVWTLNVTGNSGNAVLGGYAQFIGNGDLATAHTTRGAEVAVAITGTVNLVQRHLVASAIVPIPNEWCTNAMLRRGTNGSDTLAGDLGLMGIEYVRIT